MKNVIKKTILLLLVLIIPIYILNINTFAGSIYNNSSVITFENSDYPTNDELFSGYIDKVMYPERQISTFSNYYENLVSKELLHLYLELKENVKKIAQNGGSSVINILYYPKSHQYNLENELNKVYSEVENMITYLLYDCPYEMYWFDKTTGCLSGYKCYYNSSNIIECTFTLKFSVVKAYSDNVLLPFTSNESTYLNVDYYKASVADRVVKKANEIVKNNCGLTDYQKLYNYANAICSLTDYDSYANTSQYVNTNGYGNPWQIIYVFDENPSTKVVCEGYSKAFQYLCDLTDFCSNVECHIVTGFLYQNYEIAGGHMWNSVTLGGKSYLVDITNCDGYIFDTSLFFKGYKNTIESNGKTIYNYKYYNYVISYAFDEDSENVYGNDIDSILNYSSLDFNINTPLHTFDLQVAGEKYLASTDKERCENSYYYSCGCHERGERTFTLSVKDDVICNINDDSSIDLLDLIKLKKALIFDYGYSIITDLNRDGSVNSIDVVYLLRYILKNI